MQIDLRTRKVICAACTVGDGAHSARRDVVAAAAADRRSLHALRNEPRAAIGAAMRSSSRFNGQRSFAFRPSEPSLHVVRGRCTVIGTRAERRDMLR